MRRLLLLAALAGFATAALVGLAVAKTFTLQVAKQARVSNASGGTTREAIVVDSHGRAVYELSGDSPRHPKCTRANSCTSFWPPLTIGAKAKPTKVAGVPGKLGVWRHSGIRQVTLAGHPLYRYAGDSQRATATGQGIRTFGGTWRVVRAAGAQNPSGTPTGTTTGTTPAPTTPCLYPPYC
jgi:predicted lipoprotein with Yx(FWY)xxD motif